MAATASTSSDVCSPTGSVLITRNSLATNPVCFDYFDMSHSIEDDGGDDATARESADGDVTIGHHVPQAESFPSTLHDDDHKGKDGEESGDWINFGTLDPALIRFTLDESNTDGFHTPEPPPESLTFVQQDISTCEQGFRDPTRAPGYAWMQKLRRRASHRRRRQPLTSIEDKMLRSDSADGLQYAASITSRHYLSSSGSSFGFVEAVKTASISLASGSNFSRSRRHSVRSSRAHTHTDRSSRASISSNRCSEDSTCLDKPRNPDKAAVERSLQRRRILEELIRTEEDYIGDVRFLMNVGVSNVGKRRWTYTESISRFTSRFSCPYPPCLSACGHP